MCDYKKTKKVLIEELRTLRSRVAELKQIEAECRKAEEALSNKTKALDAIIANLKQGIAYLDENNTIIYLNQQCADLFGLKYEDVFQKNVYDFHSPEKRGAVEALINEFKQGKQYLNMVETVGNKVLDNTFHRIQDGDGNYRGILMSAVDITERKKAEAKTEETHVLLHAIIEETPDCIFLKDRQSRYQILNTATAHALGKTSVKEIAGRDDMEILSPEQARRLQEADRRIMNSGKSEVCEEQVGDQTFLSMKTPYRDKEDNVMGIIGIARDITERKRAEEAMRESEQRFRSLVETTSDWVWEVDQDGIYTYASPKVKDLLGYEPEEIIGKTPFDLMPLDEAGRVAALFKDIVQSQKAFDGLQNTNLHKDGQLVVLETSGVPILDEGENLLGYRGIDRDITERKQAEEALRREKKRAEEYLSVAGVMLAIVNVDENITMINERGREILGYEEGELIGSNWFNTLVPKRIRGKVRAVFRKLMAGSIEPVEYYENPLLTKDGEERIIVFHNTVIRASNGQIAGTLTSGEDITERKKAEEELQKARDELEIRVEQRTRDLAKVNEELHKEINERQKAEEKLLIYQRQLRSLASELSLSEERLRRRIATDIHDHIGQNLAISKIKLESLAQLISSPELGKSLNDIVELIARIIESTRSLTFELSPPVLYELGFEAAMEWLVRQMREQHGLSTEFRGDGQSKPLDDNVRVLLFQAVRELLVNVAKHAQARNVTVSTQMAGDEIRVDVEDDGVGFDISQAGSHDYKTGGFGLFSIRERLGHIGGYLNIESKRGVGTRVTLMAPIGHKEENR